MQDPDTIFALASGQGRAAIAVIRISGPRTKDALIGICGGLPAPRHAALRSMVDPQSGSLIDRGLVLWFPAPSSFTGEDMAELHIHGGRAVSENMVNALLTLEGIRLADPGEFAMRAFENEKLDLSEIEGLADLVNAETTAQARQALTQAEGGLRARAEAWRELLLRAQALAEAGIDFSDESDVAADALAQSAMLVEELLEALRTELASRHGERLREGFRVVIAGPPNAGKSSLLNALARRDVAIVSNEAGTTRDAVDIHLDLDGLPVRLSDTAGLHDQAEGAIEQEGMRRALARAKDADLVIWLIDATAPHLALPQGLTESLPAKALMRVANKCDLAAADQASGADLAISAKTGEGLEALLAALSGAAKEALIGGGESAVITRARHRHEIEAAAEALAAFLAEPCAAVELRAEELRRAAAHLGRLTGRIDVEDILGAIFSEFCIGK